MNYFIEFFTNLRQQKNESRIPIILSIFNIIYISIIILILIFIYKLLQIIEESKLPEQQNNEQNQTLIYWEQWLEPLDSCKKIPEFEQFILSEKATGRLGNQMFRFATLYATGQLLNRTPVYAYNDCQIFNFDEEFEYLFPNFHSRIYFLKEDFNDTYLYPFATDCCDLIDTNVLKGHNITNKALVLTGVSVYLNVHYFDHLRPQIQKLFEFSKEVINKCSIIRNQMLSDDYSHKICVHTRVGDFIGNGESRTEQTNKAIETIIKNHTVIENATFSLILFGIDRNFLNTIKVNVSISNIYYLIDANMTRGEEMNFAIQSCDSFLSTASLSSYAFWIAYLMPEDRPKFYVPIIYPTDTRQILPRKWIILD